MNLDLAHTIAGAPSIGASYNSGRGIISDQSSNEIIQDDLFQNNKNIDNVKSFKLEGEINSLNTSDENIFDFDSELPLAVSAEETAEEISALELNDFLQAVAAAASPKFSQKNINSLLTAGALATIGYLILQNQTLQTENTTLTSKLKTCESKENYPIGLNIGFPFFYGSFSNSILNLFNNSPNSSNTTEPLSSSSNTICKAVPFKKGDIQLGLQRRCLERSITMNTNSPEYENTIELTYQPILDTLKPFNGTSPLYDRIKLSCKQSMETNLTHLNIKVDCMGIFEINNYGTFFPTISSPKQKELLPTIKASLFGKETVTLSSQLEKGTPIQVGHYTSRELIGGKDVQKENVKTAINDQLRLGSLPSENAFPGLEAFTKSGSAQEVINFEQSK